MGFRNVGKQQKFKPVISPDGKTYHFDDIVEFCEIHKIPLRSMRRLQNGNCASSKGWKLHETFWKES